MPYRRLPNTDKARLRSLTALIEKAKKTPADKLAFSLKYYKKIEYYLTYFKQLTDTYSETLKRQTDFGKIYRASMRKAKIYISHFLQVMQMAIERGDLPSDTLNFFGIKKSVPALQSEKEIIHWGKKIIEAEKKRLSIGLTPIQNPSMAIVQANFIKFVENMKFYEILKNKTASERQKVKKIRPEIDKLIRDIWNEIEEYFSAHPAIIKREKAKEYGIVYIFRKNEEKISLDDILNF